MSFKENKYEVIRQAVSWDMANFLLNYVTIKGQVAKKLIDDGHEDNPDLIGDIGSFTEIVDGGDKMYSIYSDVAIDTLLLKVRHKVEEVIEERVLPTYSYVRIYPQGSVLKPHTDREECEVSVSMFLGGTKWDLFIGGEKIDLNIGDMVIYAGTEVQHWREPFDKDSECVQALLHYQRMTNPKANPFDGRGQIGLPERYTLRNFSNYLGHLGIEMDPTEILEQQNEGKIL
jgi:hypothetical protein